MDRRLDFHPSKRGSIPRRATKIFGGGLMVEETPEEIQEKELKENTNVETDAVLEAIKEAPEGTPAPQGPPSEDYLKPNY